MTGILIITWLFKDRETQEEHYVKRVGWSNASTRQGTTKIASKSLEAKKRQERIPLQVSKGLCPC